jgi:hypothetical protein
MGRVYFPPQGRVVLPTQIMSGIGAHARLPARSTPEPPSPDESGSEDESGEGTAYSSIGEASSLDCSTGGAADSADTDPPDMRGACFALRGDYVYCLAWFMCVVMSAMELG